MNRRWISSSREMSTQFRLERTVEQGAIDLAEQQNLIGENLITEKRIPLQNLVMLRNEEHCHSEA